MPQGRHCPPTLNPVNDCKQISLNNKSILGSHVQIAHAELVGNEELVGDLAMLTKVTLAS